MSRSFAWALAAAACLALASPAAAHAYRHRHVHYHGHGSHYAGSHVMHDVLVADPYGDVVIDGKTGFHRSDWGVMVPDSAPQSFIATGRASGSGLGANGLPGSNWQ